MHQKWTVKINRNKDWSFWPGDLARSVIDHTKREYASQEKKIWFRVFGADDPTKGMQSTMEAALVTGKKFKEKFVIVRFVSVAKEIILSVWENH